METLKIKFDTCTLSYTQTREDGIPVILLHENSLSSKTFNKILESHLGGQYRLIAIDLPGHGDSTYSDSPIEDYSLPGLANLLSKICTHLFAENAVLIGHGLGGYVILEALQNMPWVRGICLFGAPPLSSVTQINAAFLENGGITELLKGNLSEEEIIKLARNFAHEDHVPLLKELIQKTDYRFRKYFGNWIKSGEFFNQKEFLRYNQVPIAIFHGEFDKMVNYKYISNIKIENLWDKKVKIIKNSSHCPQLEEPKKLTELVTDFITYVLNGN